MSLGVNTQKRFSIFQQYGGGMAQVLTCFFVYEDVFFGSSIQIDEGQRMIACG